MNYWPAIKRSIQDNQNRWFLIASGLVLLLAMLLRLWNIGSESAWIDEAYSINLAQHTVSDILTGTAADQHPPLYYLLLKFWLIFGSGVTYARMLSVIIGVICIAQVLHLGKYTAGPVIGLLGGLLVCVSPMHVWYSQEIRMYILLVSLTIASTTSLWWALHGRSASRWAVYAIFSLLAIYTHYFAFLILFSQGIWALLWAWNQINLRHFWYWLISIFTVGLLFLPWLPVAINQFRFHTMTWVQSPTIAVIRDTLLRMIFGIAVLALPEILLWLLGALIVALLGWSIYHHLIKPGEEKQSFFFFTALAVIPFTAISVLAVLFPIYQFKQYLIAISPILLLTASISCCLPRKLNLAAVAVLLVSANVSLTYQQVNLSKDDWQGTAEYLEQHAAAGDVIFTNPAASSLALSLYADLDFPTTGIPENYDIITGGWEGEAATKETVEGRFKQLKESYQRLWLVEFTPEFWDEGQIIESWLELNSSLLSERNFGRIRLRLYNLSP